MNVSSPKNERYLTLKSTFKADVPKQKRAFAGLVVRVVLSRTMQVRMNPLRTKPLRQRMGMYRKDEVSIHPKLALLVALRRPNNSLVVWNWNLQSALTTTMECLTLN